MVSLSGAWQFVKRVYTDFSEKNVTFMAAGLAYNAFVSLAPILLLLFLVLSLVGGLEERVVSASQTYLPGQVANVVEQVFQSNPSAGGASVIGLVVLVWGALKIFRGLDTAFSEIYETSGENSFVDKMKDGLVVLVALGLAVVATVGVSAAFSLFADAIPYLGVLSPLVLVFGLVVAFLPMYYVFPDTDVGVKEVLPGTVFAAVGWAVFQSLFQVYLSFGDPGVGSVFGGVIVVVTYLYFSALVLLLGAVVNAVVGDHSSGAPGGVGQGATSSDTKRETLLDRDELDAYLRGLDERLTARYDAARAGGSDDEPPRPDDEVHLVEYETDEGDGRRWTVELSWDAPDESERNRSDRSPPGRSGPRSADD